MTKAPLNFLLILTFFSCHKNVEKKDITNELRGNTFIMFTVGEKDTVTLDFKDSTFTVIEYSERNLPWRISTFKNNDFLVFNNRVIAIEQTNKNTLKGLLISEKDYEVIFKKIQKPWNKELLNGIWIEEKNYALVMNDSSLKPPLPPAPPGISENDFQYPPLYEIKGDTISAKYFYQVSKSKIDISNSIEFLTINLRSDTDKVEKLWKIKELNDSSMIIDRTIENETKKFNFLTKTEENIKLIKKR